MSTLEPPCHSTLFHSHPIEFLTCWLIIEFKRVCGLSGDAAISKLLSVVRSQFFMAQGEQVGSDQPVVRILREIKMRKELWNHVQDVVKSASLQLERLEVEVEEDAEENEDLEEETPMVEDAKEDVEDEGTVEEDEGAEEETATEVEEDVVEDDTTFDELVPPSKSLKRGRIDVGRNNHKRRPKNRELTNTNNIPRYPSLSHPFDMNYCLPFHCHVTRCADDDVRICSGGDSNVWHFPDSPHTIFDRHPEDLVYEFVANFEIGGRDQMNVPPLVTEGLPDLWNALLRLETRDGMYNVRKQVQLVLLGQHIKHHLRYKMKRVC
jgi:hypothetical protein